MPAKLTALAEKGKSPDGFGRCFVGARFQRALPRHKGRRRRSPSLAHRKSSTGAVFVVCGWESRNAGGHSAGMPIMLCVGLVCGAELDLYESENRV